MTDSVDREGVIRKLFWCMTCDAGPMSLVESHHHSRHGHTLIGLTSRLASLLGGQPEASAAYRIQEATERMAGVVSQMEFAFQQRRMWEEEYLLCLEAIFAASWTAPATDQNASASIKRSRAVMKQPQTYVSTPVTVRALQWTGDNVEAVQAFIAPASPYYQLAQGAVGSMAHKSAELHVPVRDVVADERWPSIGPHVKQVLVPIGAWLTLGVGEPPTELQIIAETTFAAGYAQAPVQAQQPPSTSPTAATFQLGHAITATHPRAGAGAHDVDRQPAATADGATVDRP